jgi:hypothetical protein
VRASPRHRPPSRLRYEAEHPVIGVRVDSATYARLVALRDESGATLGALVRRSLGVVEADVAQDELACLGAYSEGQMEALGVYQITFPCSVCGQPMEVKAGSEMAQAAVAYLAERGWVHGGDCAERRRGIRQV